MKKLNLKAYRRNVKSACKNTGHRIPNGYTTDFAPNGDFIVRNYSMNVVGRLPPEEVEDFIIEK